MLSKGTSHQPRIVYFAQEVELEVGIIQFSGEKIAENWFFYRQQTNSFNIVISWVFSSV